MDDIVFIGDWVKDRVLGSGSFGVVVLWKHKRTDEKLAIKTCKWGDELTQKHRDRWTKEVEMLQNCDNPNIVGTKELPSEFIAGLERANPSKLPILCMEFCSGGDLRQLLNKPDSCAGLREVQVRQIISDVGNAMQFLHSNKITHRDLKPENIVLHVLDNNVTSYNNQNQKRVTYKLIDLGYAKEIDSKSICASFVGTLQYLAPELLYSKTYSNSVDFWSFGLLVFEVICGVRPFLPSMAPVQWMPHIKKKAHHDICVYETFHGDIEYSNEIFQENHISKPFKKLIEDWLRVALEWDPKLRGRNPPLPSKVKFIIPNGRDDGSEDTSNNIVIFNMLQNILSRKIIKLFSVSTLTSHAYEIDDSMKILTLKSLLQKDVNIMCDDQILISPSSYNEVKNDELAMSYFSDVHNVMLYLYDKKVVIKDNIQPAVPKSIQRCLENPKAMYNFKNSQILYKNALYFVLTQMETYDFLVNGLLVRAESLKCESKQLLLQHNSVDKNIGILLAKEETVSKMTTTGKKHIENLNKAGTGTNFLGGFEAIMKNADDLAEKILKLKSAWTQLSVRLESAARRSNEVLSLDLNNFISKYNYQNIFTNALKAYITYKKGGFFNEQRSKEKQCPDIIKVCYECLKLRSSILQELNKQPFIVKLIDLSVEFSKMSEIINNAGSNTDKLSTDLSSLVDELTDCTWATISILSSDAHTLADVPYSVVSYQKREYKVGEPIQESDDCISTNNKALRDDDLKTLLKNSFMIRKQQAELFQNINAKKKLLNQNEFQFFDKN